MYTECKLQATDAQQCDCNLSEVPADHPASFPEKQKEMQQQTDWKYLISEKPLYSSSLTENMKCYSGLVDHMLPTAFTNGVFRPPCFLHNII
jgi:hypothetical protein